MRLVEAVDRIYKLSLDFDDERWALGGEALTTFVVLADLWDDRPRKRPELERDIREQLQSLSAGCSFEAIPVVAQGHVATARTQHLCA